MSQSESIMRQRHVDKDDKDSNPNIGTSVHSELARGETYDGEAFLVPKTADTVAAFLDPKWINIGTIIATIPIFTMMFLTFVVQIPLWCNLIVFFFWRSMYNGGLGWLLDIQSRERRLTNWYKYWSAYPDSWQYKVLYKFTVAGLPSGSKPEDYPIAFNAWIVYKAIVNIILVNDSTNYVWIVIRCFNIPSWAELSVMTVFQYFIGVLLFIFFWWSKVDAHRCIGTYCWYWGDFFYRKNVQLTFDGIFELFPHPMYTVGYSSYYACALFSRSYTVLLVSILAHIAQLVFLVIVEEPHIKRTYGDANEGVKLITEFSSIEDSSKASPVYDDKAGLFPSNAIKSFFPMLQLSLYSASSWSTIIASSNAFLFAMFVSNPIWSVVQVIIWRIIHWGGLGYILWSQSNSQAFTKYYTDRGMSVREAFANWKSLHVLSTTVNIVAFVACVLRYLPEVDLEALFTIVNIAKIFGAIALIFVSVWTFYSTYTTVGEFGWFYADFFVKPYNYASSLCYTGIYRFLNNPDAALGYVGFYGLSILCSSWHVFWLTVFSQVLNLLFISIVEANHMKRVYTSDYLRKTSPLRNKVMSVVGKTTDVLPDKIKEAAKEAKLNEQFRTVQNRALSEIYKIYQSLSKARENERTKQNELNGGVNTKLECPKSISIGQSLEITYTTNSQHSESDWVGIYQIESPSLPGYSEGRWKYVPSGSTGTITFTPHELPYTEGVYEIRYYCGGSYENLSATKPIVLTQDSQLRSQLEDIPQSPVLTANSSDELPIDKED